MNKLQKNSIIELSRLPANREGLSAWLPTVVAEPVSIISNNNSPSAGACITPYPDGPFINIVFT